MNDEIVRRMASNGTIPTIEALIERYKSGNESLYYTIIEIGTVCDTYHKLLQTGNNVECAAASIDKNTIEALGLSLRSYNSLKRQGINTIPELLSMTDKELSECHYIGKGTIAEIKKVLDSKGYVLKEAENEAGKM